MIAPTLGDPDWGTWGSAGRLTRSMMPAHSLWDRTGLAANDSDATCHSLPSLVVSSGHERLAGALRLFLHGITTAAQALPGC